MPRTHFRIGQIVPSSNTTMETEIPALIRARESIAPERFSFHSARMRMKHVTKEELAKMDSDSDRCALELSDARVDVLGGQVQVFMTTPPSVMQHVQAGKLKAFAVTGKTRHPGLPNVPTTAEAGLTGFELEAWVALFAPAGTPPSVVQTLTEKVKLALASPEAKGAADRSGIEIRYQGPEALAALVARETDYWAQVIKAKNIKAD